MTQESKILKDKGSALRRTATSVRSAAAEMMSPGDMQTLLKAAELLDSQAQKVMEQATKRKGEEDAFTLAIAAAMPAALEVALALPQQTVAEKLALIEEESSVATIASAVRRGDSLGYIQRQINIYLAQAIDSLARYLAYSAARNNTQPAANEHLLKRLKTKRDRPDIVRIADEIERRMRDEAANHG